MDCAWAGDSVVARRSETFELYERTIWPFEFESSSEAPVYEAKLYGLPGLGIAYSTTSSSRVRRTTKHVVNDDLVLRVNIVGSRTLRQSGREASIGEGEAVLSSGAEVSAATTTASRFISFRVPLKPIKALVPDVEDRTARRIDKVESLQLLTSYAGMLRQAPATPELRRLAVTHVYDLVALTLGAVRDVAEVARMRGTRAARLGALRADIEENLWAEHLSVTTIAAKHRLPVRYVQRLFEAEGTTFTEFVLGRRLARAHGLLTDPRFAERSIGMIAYESGFGNQPYFNRAFRQRFGMTPSELRADARRGWGG